MCPQTGSLQGGTLVTITGSGFGTNKDALSIKFGDSVCTPQSITDTEVICKTGFGAAQHQITNGGSNFGKST